MFDLKEKRKEIYREARREVFAKLKIPQGWKGTRGLDEREAFMRVVDWVLEETYVAQYEANTLAHERLEAFTNEAQKTKCCLLTLSCRTIQMRWAKSFTVGSRPGCTKRRTGLSCSQAILQRRTSVP